MTVPIHTRGRISDDERERAEAVTATVVRRHHRQAQHARVRLTGSEYADGPGLIQINLRVCGAPARVQVGAGSVADTITAGAARLDRQIRRLTIAWEQWPWPDHERRSLDLSGDRDIARLKTYRLHTGTPCNATAAMNAMDYDFYLYTDADTGEDAVVQRGGPTGVQLCRQHSRQPPSMPVTLPLTVNPRRQPRLTAAQAADHLANGLSPFLFFTDIDTGRGNVLYRRYDGHLGLITPATSTQE